jgi:uncharacterized membrane protein
MASTAAVGELAGGHSPPLARSRIDSVDLLRGIVMVIMMLDHTREFMHTDILLYDPLDLSRTSPHVFFTRWITHYCAPAFVFLAGTSVYLQRMRGKPVAELSRFLVTRGLWLIVLELTIVRFGFEFNLDYMADAGALQVIWVIGVSMIVLAALIHLPVEAVGVIGILIIAFSNALDGVRVAGWRGPDSPVPGFGQALFMILHQPGPLPLFGFPGPVFFVLYPLLPWIGVMAAGYALGSVYTWDEDRRRRFLLRLGLGAITAFIALRFLNIYGDPRPWSAQPSALFTLLSFVNTTKYPVSLLFLLMTLGPAILCLALFERVRLGWFSRAMITFGRVPLFYYILQWYTAHTLAILLGLAAGQDVSWQFLPLFERFSPKPTAWRGFSLSVVYATWIFGVVLLYPLCRWFASLKQRRRDWWLSYL